jgi:hypothetical protein
MEVYTISDRQEKARAVKKLERSISRKEQENMSA